MQYKYTVKKTYGARGPETNVASCTEQNDAVTLIQAKLREDAGLKVNIIYRLYEMGEMMKEYNQDSMTASASATSSQGGGQQQSSSFRPSPLQTSPRPAGMPSSFKSEDKDKGKA